MFDLCVKCWFVPKYVQRLSDFKSKPRGCLIDDGKIVKGTCRATWALQMLENVWGPVRFVCTACTRKFINHTWSESIGDRVFHTEEASYFEGGKRYCNNANIVLAFSSFKVDSLFSIKDPIRNGLRSCVAHTWVPCFFLKLISYLLSSGPV